VAPTSPTTLNKYGRFLGPILQAAGEEQ
jgi:hypothetical protein